jgi:hypothetical protein
MLRSFGCLLGLHLTSAAAGPTASTTCGPVEGVAEGGTSVFKGIPYAAPPTGPRRWREPASLRDAGLCWDGALDATSFGAACPQSPGSLDVGAQDEDCLFVNVWAPPQPQPQPQLRQQPEAKRTRTTWGAKRETWCPRSRSLAAIAREQIAAMAA